LAIIISTKASAHAEELSSAIPGFAAALAWPGETGADAVC
jgi:hypothetical protein